jgi:hypothetical protein
MTSTSGTNHTQFHKIIFSADRRCPRQLHNGLYTTWLFLFHRSVVYLGGQEFDIEFYCKHQLNSFEMTESTNWKKGIGIENLKCNHHQRSTIFSFY